MSIVFSPTPSQKRLRPADEPPDSTTGVGKSKFSPKASSTVLPYATIVAEAFGENFDFPTPVVESGG
ncbi:MAG: hypothetical protein AAFV31_17395, partial [Pseudomonadota bacterium]